MGRVVSPRLCTLYQFGQPFQIEKLNHGKKIGFFTQAMDVIDDGSIAKMCVRRSFLCLLITANCAEMPLVCVVSCVFIGRSYKKIKFFLFLCRIT